MAVNGSNYFEWTPNASEVPADEANPILLITGAEIGTGHGFWTNVASDGSDIRVTLDDGTTEQPFHVIHIDTAAEELYLRFRSTITLTASAPETFRVYYNSADAAYAVTDPFGRNNVYQDYEAWWGLDQDPTGTAPQMTDYTGNGYDATANGNPTAQAGIVDQEIAFDGAGDYFTFSPTIVVDGNMSIRSWMSFASRSTHVGEVGNNQNYFRIDETGNWGMIDDSGFSEDTTWTIAASQNTDYLITIASNTSDEWSAFRSATAASNNPQTQTAAFHMNGIGRGRGDGSSDMDGTLDETAVANFTYDLNRNTLETNNEGSPATFASAGAEETAGGDQTISLSDSISITDSLNSASNEFTVSDSIGYTDNANFDIRLLLADSISYNDSLNSASNQFTLSDSITIVDSLSQLSNLVNLSDSVSISDSLKNIANTFTLADSISITDSIQITKGNFIELSDSIGFTDSIKTLEAVVSVSDSIGFNDSLASIGAEMTITDSISISDSLQQLTVQVSLSDSVSFTDTLTVSKQGIGDATKVTIDAKKLYNIALKAKKLYNINLNAEELID